jgi:membrane protease YdiL (CAAX protease family)
MLLPLVLLLIALGGMAFVIRRDREAYRRFKAIEDTALRQKIFRQWIAVSFALHIGYTLLSLALLGRLASLTELPDAFIPAWLWLGGPSTAAPDTIEGLAIGGALGAAIALPAVLAIRRRKTRGEPKTLGDIAALMPRNRAELAHVAVLSINAGIAEELFYRLTLPLLFVLVIGNVWIAFMLATLAFGLVHFYQGWGGIVATTVIGALFAICYLAIGSIWAAALVHAAMDLAALVVRPLLNGSLARADPAT